MVFGKQRQGTTQEKFFEKLCDLNSDGLCNQSDEAFGEMLSDVKNSLEMFQQNINDEYKRSLVYDNAVKSWEEALSRNVSLNKFDPMIRESIAEVIRKLIAGVAHHYIINNRYIGPHQLALRCKSFGVGHDCMYETLDKIRNYRNRFAHLLDRGAKGYDSAEDFKSGIESVTGDISALLGDDSTKHVRNKMQCLLVFLFSILVE